MNAINSFKFLFTSCSLWLSSSFMEHHRINNIKRNGFLNSRLLSQPENVLNPGLSSLHILESFNEKFLRRMDEGRKQGRTFRQVDFDYAQSIGANGIKNERLQLRNATIEVSSAAKEIIISIMAENCDRALTVLRSWVIGLGLKKGVLRAMNDDSIEVDIGDLQSSNSAVYVKYNSSDNGDAYMKPYNGDYRGVIFQPLLDDLAFRQYGNLPLATFPSS